MDREKLIKQLFVGKVTEIIGTEKTTELLKEATVAIDEMLKSCKADVSGSATVDINTQVEILKKVINKLMITFDDENDRMDYILDICNEYRKEVEKH